MSEQATTYPKAEVDLSQVVKDISKRKWIILAVALCSAIAGFTFASMKPQEYESTAILRIEKDNTPVQSNALQSLLGGSAAEAPSEIATIKSRAILSEVTSNPFAKALIYPIGKAGKSLGLSEKLTPPLQSQNPFPFLLIDDVEIPKDWVEKKSPIFITYDGKHRISIALPDGENVLGEVGSVATNKLGTFRLLVRDIASQAGQEFKMIGRSKISALENLSEALQVSEIKSTNLIKLNYKNTSPAAANAVLGDIVTTYRNYNETYKVSQAQRRLEYVESQLPKAIQAIDNAEHALIEYQKSNQTIGVQFQTEEMLKRLGQVEEALRQGQIPKEKEKLEATKKEIISDLSGLPDAQQRTQALVRDIEIAQEIYLELMKVVQTLRVARAGTQSTVSILDVPFSNEKRLHSAKRLAVVISVSSAVLYILWIIVWVSMRTPEATVIKAPSSTRTGHPK